MLNISAILAAKQRLEPVVFKTPLVDHSAFFPFQLYSKLENLQKTGAFKIRGAYNKIAQLSEEEKNKGIICASAGNHAQGVAYSAKLLGIDATVVMPRYAPLAKIEASREYRVKVILHGDSFEEAYAYAQQLQKENSQIFIEPYNDYEVIAGQATIALEILEKLEAFDYILVPIGGGGLLAGIAYTIKQFKPDVKVIGIEAANASTMYESIHHDKIIAADKVDTFADGIAVRQVGQIPFKICKTTVDQVITVNETEINKAVLFALEKFHLVVEGAGAVGLAALLADKLHLKPQDKVVNIISGGNIDITLLTTLIDRGLRQCDRKITFGTRIQDKPGSLNKLLELLAEKQANIITVNHDRYHHNTSAMTCYVEITIDTFDAIHQADIFETLRLKNYDYRIK